jgi:hypothetical protein
MKLLPWWRSLRRRRKEKPSEDPLDAIGEAVNNIFSYEKEKRRRK